MKPAYKEDWTTHPLPEQHAVLGADWRYTPDEARRMRQGLIPEVMEDKWFIYYADGRLFFHRSWTGFCIYQVELIEDEAHLRLGEIRVSRDMEQYRETTTEFDLQLLRFLIDHLLLGKQAAFPQIPGTQSPVEIALLRHGTVGHARSHREIEGEGREQV